MELRQLKYFVAVAKDSSFTRAAARLHVAQPGVSAQIRRLERELGEELLDRSGRSVRLTEAGAAVLPYAQAALAAVAGARLAVDELTGLMRGHVTIGTVTSISSEDVDLPGLLSDFHHDYPAVEITLTVGNSDHLVQALQAGQIDIAFVGLSTAAAPPGIRTHIVISEPLVAVVSHNDPLAMKTTVTLKALSERRLISLPRGTGLRACLDEVCAALGFQPHIAFEAGDPRVLAELAARGLGVAIVPHSVARARCKQLHNIAITRPELWGRIALAWRTDKPISPATRALISRTQTVLPDPTKDQRPTFGHHRGDRHQEVLSEQLAARQGQRNKADGKSQPGEHDVVRQALDEQQREHPDADVEAAEKAGGQQARP